MLKPHLQFFPLAFAAAIYFLAEGEAQSAILRKRDWAFPLWFLGLFVAAAALYLGSPWLGHFAAIVLLFIWSLVARPHLSTLRIVGICGLLLVTLPPPFGWDKQLVSGLQSLSSFACSRLMDLTQILHVRRGNIIDISSKPLFVEEACSGVDSQYALMAVAGVLLLLGRAGFWVSLLTIITVPIWAILGNLLRIYLIVIGLEWFSTDLSKGSIHTILGLLVFAFTAWVHWSSVQLLNYMQLTLLPSSAIPSKSHIQEPEAIQSQDGLRSLKLTWAAIPIFLLVFFPESVRAVFDYHARPDLPSISLEDSEKFPGSGALSSAGGLQVVGYHSVNRNRDDMLGQHSRVWEVQGDVGQMTVCLDFPFRGWHPLWECYINSGWERIRSDLVSSTDSPFFETVLKNELGDLAILHFSLFDENGDPYGYEGSMEFRKQAQRWTKTLFTRKRPGDPLEDPITFQFQQIAYTATTPTESQLEDLRRSFVDSRQQIVSQSASALRNLKQQSVNASR